MKTITLVHYYCIPEVQALADYVGDSLDLAQKAQAAKADRIVFAGVRFMSETAKLLNPHAEVILPDAGSTCSLVEGTHLPSLKRWRKKYLDHTHVAYINSSVEHKATADWIVTSRNAPDIIEYLYERGEKIIFSPDRNLGEYFNHILGIKMPVWTATCEVHAKFNNEALDKAFVENAIKKPILVAHPESPLSVLKRADYIGSTHGLLNYIKDFRGDNLIYVATEAGILFNMKEARPDLDIHAAPIFLKTCSACAECFYMKLNTVEKVIAARDFGIGTKIDYIKPEIVRKALVPIKRMMAFSS